MRCCKKCGQDLDVVGSYKGLVCKECRKHRSVALRKNYRQLGLCGCGRSVVRGRMCERCKEFGRTSYAADLIREELLVAYGWKCSCCGETRQEFLTIDHAPPLSVPTAIRTALTVNGASVPKSSAAHRPRSGRALYLWLRSRGFPKDGYRLLCMNCNASRGFWGYCPHERELGFCELFYGGRKHTVVFSDDQTYSKIQKLWQVPQSNSQLFSDALAASIETVLAARDEGA